MLQWVLKNLREEKVSVGLTKMNDIQKKKKKTYVNSVVCIVFLTFIFIIILFFLSSGIYSFDKTTSFLIILHIEYGHTKKERGGINVLVIGMLSHNLILRVGRNEYLRP